MSAETKLELLGLIDSATSAGWPHLRACSVLELADVRAHRWRVRLRQTGTLEDRPPVGAAVHRLLEWEEQAILELIEQWGWVDRSHRKLAHRGSYTGAVFVSPSTLLRVALKHRVELPGEPHRPRPARPVLPELPWERNRIWIWDATDFTRAARRLRAAGRPTTPRPAGRSSSAHVHAAPAARATPGGEPQPAERARRRGSP